jgi:uncharacterized protein
MGKRYLAVIGLMLLLCPAAVAAAPSQIRISVFNFDTVNLEASGLGATVTNMLISQLSGESTLSVLDRKELEAFLSMNDLQQNDKIDNVANIGTRLGLDVIIVGSVEKKGSMIVVSCKAIQIDQKKSLLNARAGAVGDAALAGEVRKLSQQIKTIVAEQLRRDKSGAGGDTIPAPVQVRKRPGNRSIQLSWEDAPGAAAAGYDVFRAVSEGGPYSSIAQVAKPEHLDETVDKDTRYYYKIRAYNDRGLQSAYSQVVEAKTAVTPNPPVILKAEGRVKGIALLWSPGPGGEDPLPLKGYRIYRARNEQGPYREILNIQSQSGAGEGTIPIDKLTKVPLLDKGLGDGEEYHYRVTAYNEKELESGFSRSVKGVTIPAVGSVTAEGELIREIRLSWKALDSPFIKGYNVYRSTAEKEIFSRIKQVEAPTGGPGKKIDYADREGLGDQTRYYYRITAYEEGDAETASSPTAFAVTRGKPPRPEELKAEGGLVKRVELKWKASTAEDVEGYRLYWSREKDGQYVVLKTFPGRTTDRYTDSSRGFDKLDDGAAYHYRLTAYNRVEVESEATPIVSAATKPRPSKPSGLKGQGGKAKSVPLSWSANPEKDVAAYHLFRAAGAQGEDFERVTKIQVVDYLDSGLKDNLVYRYRLQAEDRDGLLSDFSETVSVQTKPRPARLEGAGGQVSEGKAVLNWKASGESDIAHYTVYEKKIFGTEKITTVREAAFSEPGPPKGKTKTYIITATDRDGLESDPGPEIPVTGP